MSTLIKNVSAYVGETLENIQTNLFINDQGIIELINNEQANGAKYTSAEVVISGNRYVAVPSFTDLHVHFREPGFEKKETLVTGQRAAIKGGVGMVCTMPNTKPPIDRPSRLADYLERIEKNQVIQILPSVAISLNQAGAEITDLVCMTEMGAKAYTDDGRTVMSEEMLKKALEVSQKTHCPVMTHSEDHEQASLYPGKPYPAEVESDIVRRDIQIHKKIGGHLHIAHLSVIQSLNAVIQGKMNQQNVTCEVSPHHLYFNADELDFDTAKYKVNPPLRGEENRKMLLEGIKKGWVDAIASDHAPHETETKEKDYQNGSYGFIGLETMFSVCNTIFADENIEFPKLIEMMSFNPRKILNQATNPIENGAVADLILIDLEEIWKVSHSDFESKSENSPWIGLELKGKVKHYFKSNQHLLNEGEVQWPLRD